MGGSDCERIGQGLLGQPANTLSSLAYVLAGALLLWRAVAGRRHASLGCVVYAAAVIAVGAGSVAFHGPMPGWGRFAHDLSIAAVLAFVIGYDVALVRGAAVARGLVIFGALTGVCAVVLTGWPDAADGLDVLLVAGAVAAEVAAARSPAARALADARVWIVGAGVLAIGAILNALGRTGGPWCDADSLVQLHAVWHVVTAFVLWLYGVAVLGPRERARPKIRA
ncbi:MAG TPA: ceramidase domain-containing protein [Acidimicrobiia bacterium]|nr:ceramidase domain-containing protein [Acidimicrobiia bacterium]